MVGNTAKAKLRSYLRNVWLKGRVVRRGEEVHCIHCFSLVSAGLNMPRDEWHYLKSDDQTPLLGNNECRVCCDELHRVGFYRFTGRSRAVFFIGRIRLLFDLVKYARVARSEPL